MTPSRFSRPIFAGITALVLGLGIGLTSLAPADAATPLLASTHSFAATPASSNVVSPQILTWSPYDSSHITTEAKCKARMNYLIKVQPSFAFKCEEFVSNTCPSSTYWMVMCAEKDGFIVLQPSDAKAIEHASASSQVTCG